MKALYLVLFVLLLSLYNSQTCGDYAEKAEECTNIHFFSGYCCYQRFKQSYKGSSLDKRTCEFVSENEYENIKDYVDYHKKKDVISGWKVDVFKIDCGSKYISYSLLLLFILLL